MAKIQVHLEFDTIAEVTAFFAGQATKPATPTSVADHLKKISDESKVKPDPKPEASAPVASTPPPPSPTPPPPPPATTSGIDYDRDLGPKILELVKKNRAAAVEILAAFGVKKGPDLKPDQWAECVAKVDAALLV